MPGKLHGQRSLEGYGPWGRTQSDTTEQRIQDGETGLGVEVETGLGVRRWTQGSRVEHGVDVGGSAGVAVLGIVLDVGRKLGWE